MQKAKGIIERKAVGSSQTIQGVDWHAPPGLLANGFPAHVAWLYAGSSLWGVPSELFNFRDSRTHVATTQFIKDSLQRWPE